MQETVRFRLEYSVRALGLGEDESLEFSVDQPFKGHVLLRAGNGERGLVPGEAILHVTVERKPADAVRTVLTSLSRGELPSGVVRPQHMPESAWAKQVQGQRFTGALPLAGFSGSFHAYCLQLYDELCEIAQQATLAFRWRANIDGPHNPFRSRGWRFCLESDDWTPMPSTIRGIITVGLARPKDLSALAPEIGALVASGGEPLGHQMLREAWMQRVENPRSAIVLGIAAVEVGLKEYIAVAVPGARWLVEELPTPPVVTMLRDYLPTLTRADGAPGTASPPPETTLKVLTKGVRLRNRAAHVGAKISNTEAESVLRAVRDVLWLLDFYRGHRWVLQYVGEDVRKALLRDEVPPA